MPYQWDIFNSKCFKSPVNRVKLHYNLKSVKVENSFCCNFLLSNNRLMFCFAVANISARIISKGNLCFISYSLFSFMSDTTFTQVMSQFKKKKKKEKPKTATFIWEKSRWIKHTVLEKKCLSSLSICVMAQPFRASTQKSLTT